MHDTMKKPRHKTPSAAKRARSASGADEGDRQDKGRWSSRRKTEVVLRLFRGETLDALSREIGVTPGKLAEWCDEALAGMQAGSSRASPTSATASSTTSRPRSATRPCRSRSWRTASTLRRGGHRFEPVDITLREEALRHPPRLQGVAAHPRHRPRHKALANTEPKLP